MHAELNSDLLRVPVEAYMRARSLGFTIESFLLNGMASILPRKMQQSFPDDRELLNQARKALQELFRKDAQNIAAGVYPLGVLEPESPLKHLGRLPRVILDGLGLSVRRGLGKTQKFDASAREWLADLPRYYRRNFHFQTDGYMSEASAELYEHQVEILFSGAADAMRRLILPPLRQHLDMQDRPKNGHGLTFLEIASGTGRTTRFLRQAFPMAKIVSLDLSDPYLHVARKRLARYSRIDFIQADAAHLPFQNAQFDAVVSVFLFHELPEEERSKVLLESMRVLKPGGFHGLVDSMQRHDRPELTPLFEAFPKNYHEPFYRNYSEIPMEGLLTQTGFQAVHTELGFLSKMVRSTKKNNPA